jgi:hypothetical protein
MECFVCCTVNWCVFFFNGRFDGIKVSRLEHDIRATKGKKQFLLLHFGVLGLYWT